MIVITQDKARELTDDKLKTLRQDYTATFLEQADLYLKEHPEDETVINLLSYGINALTLENESLDRIIDGYNEQIKKVLGNMALTEQALGKDPVKC